MYFLSNHPVAKLVPLASRRDAARRRLGVSCNFDYGDERLSFVGAGTLFQDG